MCLLIFQSSSERVQQQYSDNLKWVREAGKHQLVVGSQARILYSDHAGRVAIATRFNHVNSTTFVYLKSLFDNNNIKKGCYVLVWLEMRSGPGAYS